MTIHNQSIKPESDISTIPIFIDDPNVVQQNQSSSGETIDQLRLDRLSAVMSEKRMAVLEGIVACVIIVFGIISHSLSPGFFQYTLMAESCKSATAIWAGFFGVFSAGFGLSVVKYGYKNKNVLLAHFAVCLVNAITLATLITFESINVSIVYYYVCGFRGSGRDDYNRDRDSYNRDDNLWVGQLESLATFVLALKILIITCTPIRLISNIASFVRVCCRWKDWTDVPTPTPTSTSGNDIAKPIPLQTVFQNIRQQLTDKMATRTSTLETSPRDIPATTPTEKIEKEEEN